MALPQIGKTGSGIKGKNGFSVLPYQRNLDSEWSESEPNEKASKIWWRHF